MNRQRITLFTGIILLTLILLSLNSALTAGNIVPATRLSDQGFPILTSDLAPAACAGLNLTQIVYASGLTFGTDAGDLILGSGSGDIIFGLGGEDCILGGGGNDILLGGVNQDVCIGGPGSDSFTWLFWGGCELQIQ